MVDDLIATNEPEGLVMSMLRGQDNLVDEWAATSTDGHIHVVWTPFNDSWLYLRRRRYTRRPPQPFKYQVLTQDQMVRGPMRSSQGCSN